MKKITALATAAIILAVLGLGVGSQYFDRDVAAADIDAKSHARAALVEYLEAYRAKDIDKIMSMYSDEAVVMGTGPGERWEGLEEIRAAHLEQFKSYDKEVSELTWSSGGARGDVAWGMAMVDVTNYYKNVQTNFALNLSVVLVKESRKWKVMNIHASNLTGDYGEMEAPADE